MLYSNVQNFNKLTYKYINLLTNNWYILLRGYMNTKEVFGKRFKEIRKKFGYTQDKMAEIAGIEPQSISKIESGKNFPLLSNLDKIATKLGISLEDFFDYKHIETNENMRTEIVEIFDSLNIQDKQKLLRLARVLKI